MVNGLSITKEDQPYHSDGRKELVVIVGGCDDRQAVIIAPLLAKCLEVLEALLPLELHVHGLRVPDPTPTDGRHYIRALGTPYPSHPTDTAPFTTAVTLRFQALVTYQLVSCTAWYLLLALLHMSMANSYSSRCINCPVRASRTFQ